MGGQPLPAAAYPQRAHVGRATKALDSLVDVSNRLRALESLEDGDAVAYCRTRFVMAEPNRVVSDERVWSF